MAVPKWVWIVTLYYFDHDGEERHQVAYESETAAMEALYQYANAWWDDVLPDALRPTATTSLVNEFFDHVEGESYTIHKIRFEQELKW
jgi:hypothetical protein